MGFGSGHLFSFLGWFIGLTGTGDCGLGYSVTANAVFAVGDGDDLIAPGAVYEAKDKDVESFGFGHFEPPFC